MRDREHAIFNVLRFYEARTAIVFCKTRVNVNHLFARMGNRGFQVVALSGGYSRDDANAKLARNHGIIASFSRALTEGLSAKQADADFDKALGHTVDAICEASKAG